MLNLKICCYRFILVLSYISLYIFIIWTRILIFIGNKNTRRIHMSLHPPFFMLLLSKWPTNSRFVELSEDDIYHFCEQQENVNLLASACLFLL